MVRVVLANVGAAAALSLTSACANAQTPPIPSVGDATATASAQGGGIFDSIFGCSAPGSKQVIGAAGGGVIGGAVGNRVAGKGNRKIGTVVGAAVGAAAGSALGCKLQRDDQRRAEEAAVRAAQTNEAQSWTNPETGASGTAEAIQSGGQLAGLTLAPAVQPVASYSGAGGYYVATTNANVRTMPSLDGQVVGQLARGEKILVAGAATETGWLLVARDGVGKGYVSPTLLQRQPDAANSCKLIRHSITVPGKGTEVQNLRACLNPDGNWVFSPATAAQA